MTPPTSRPGRSAGTSPGTPVSSTSPTASWPPALTWTYIDAQHGRFVTILPRSRAEDAAGRAAIAAGRPDFQTGPHPARPPRQRPAADLGDSSRARAVRRGLAGHLGPVLSQARAGLPRPRRPHHPRHDRLGPAGRPARLAPLQAENRSRHHPGRRQAITAAGACRWVSYAITRHDTVTRKQISTGRPGPDTRYQDVTVTRCTLHPVTDTARAARDAASDGCFPLITDDKALTPAQILDACKRQPGIEPRHHTFKTVLRAVPVHLTSPGRIDALSFCLYAALLVHALPERQLRRAATAAGLPPLPLYHENRQAPAPSGALILAELGGIAVTTITTRKHATVVPPELTRLQHQLITLLDIPPASYHQHQAHHPRQARKSA